MAVDGHGVPQALGQHREGIRRVDGQQLLDGGQHAVLRVLHEREHVAQMQEVQLLTGGNHRGHLLGVVRGGEKVGVHLAVQTLIHQVLVKDLHHVVHARLHRVEAAVPLQLHILVVVDLLGHRGRRQGQAQRERQDRAKQSFHEFLPPYDFCIA